MPNNRAWALFFARSILGLIFFMAGVFKVFSMGPMEHARQFFIADYADSFLPIWSLWTVGVLIPIVELFAGVLVLVGLRVREATVALGVVLIVVTFGHLLADPLYQFHVHVMPRLGLVLFILMVPAEYDTLTIDAVLRRISQSRPSRSSSIR